MKVYKKIVIDIESGDILSEKFYNYNGPIAQCIGGGGSHTDTEYVQSPEARQAMQMMMPTIQRIGLAGQYGGYIPEGLANTITTPTLNYGGLSYPYGPYMGETPFLTFGRSKSDYGFSPYTTSSSTLKTPITSGLLWEPGTYNIPDITSMMPTTETMASISPDVKAAVMAPYKETEQQLLETLGGSPRGGFSGQSQAALGRYWADVAPEYTQSLWGMTAPAQQAGWAAELGRGKDIWGQEQAAKQFPYTVIPGMFGESMPTPVTTSSGGKK